MSTLIRRMQGPTGRVTELTFIDGEFNGFRIIESNGKLVDDLAKRGDVWKSAGGGRQADDVTIDRDNNISILETDGNRTAHLACGEELLTRYSREGLPMEALALKDGKETARFGFEWDEGRFSAYAKLPDMPEPMPVKPEDTALVSRLRAAGLAI